LRINKQGNDYSCLWSPEPVITTYSVSVITNEEDGREDAAPAMKAGEDNVKMKVGELGFCRFQVSVPTNVIITDAYLEFVVNETKTGDSVIQIYADDSSNSAVIDYANNSNISDRTSTSAKVDWSTTADWTINDVMQSPNITDVVQEIIDHSGGWTSGNSMTFIMKMTSGDEKKVASFEHALPPPKLVVKYKPKYNLRKEVSGLAFDPLHFFLAGKSWAGNSFDFYFDDFRIRKFLEEDPTKSYGAEENLVLPGVYAANDTWFKSKVNVTNTSVTLSKMDENGQWIELINAAITYNHNKFGLGSNNTVASFDNFSVWNKASCSGSDGSTSVETITATAIPYGVKSDDQNKIKYCISDTKTTIGYSEIYTVDNLVGPFAPTFFSHGGSTVNHQTSLTEMINTIEPVLVWNYTHSTPLDQTGYYITMDGTEYGFFSSTVVSGSNGKHPFTTAVLSRGTTHVWKAKVIDTVGNPSSYSADFTFYLNQAPGTSSSKDPNTDKDLWGTGEAFVYKKVPDQLTIEVEDIDDGLDISSAYWQFSRDGGASMLPTDLRFAGDVGNYTWHSDSTAAWTEAGGEYKSNNSGLELRILSIETDAFTGENMFLFKHKHTVGSSEYMILDYQDTNNYIIAGSWSGAGSIRERSGGSWTVLDEEAGGTQSDWWDTNWGSRKSLTVNNPNGGTLTDFQFQVTIPWEANMDNEFDDIRVTTSDGVTSLPYWIESKTDGVTATVWVKATLATGDNDFDVYFENAIAASESNANNVMYLFEDFETDDGTWTYSETDSEYDDLGYVTDQKHGGSKSYSLRNNDDVDDNAICKISRTITLPSVCDIRFSIWHRAVDNGADNYYSRGVLIEGTTYLNDMINGNPEDWAEYTTTHNSGSTNITIELQEKAENNGGFADRYVWWDDIIVRQFAASDPTPTLGSTEPLGSGGGDTSYAATDTYFESKVTLTKEATITNTAPNWWTAGANWNKRRTMTINNPNGALNEFQVQVTVAFQTGMQSDFDDLRFTSSDGTTLYNHWVESKSDGVTATIWVKVPLVNGNNDFHVYYDNASAPNISNVDNVMYLFEDFETNDGTWTYSEEEDSYDNLGYVTDEKHGGSYSYGIRNNDKVGDLDVAKIVRTITLPSACDIYFSIWHRAAKLDGDNDEYSRRVYIEGTKYLDDYINGNPENWAEYTTTHSSGATNITIELQQYSHGTSATEDRKIWWDDIIIRQHAASTPTDSWGTIEDRTWTSTESQATLYKKSSEGKWLQVAQGQWTYSNGRYGLGSDSTTAKFENFSAWNLADSCTGTDGTNAIEIITVNSVPFNKYATDNKMRYCISDMIGEIGFSDPYTVQTKPVPPDKPILVSHGGSSVSPQNSNTEMINIMKPELIWTYSHPMGDAQTEYQINFETADQGWTAQAIPSGSNGTHILTNPMVRGNDYDWYVTVRNHPLGETNSDLFTFHLNQRPGSAANTDPDVDKSLWINGDMEVVPNPYSGKAFPNCTMEVTDIDSGLDIDTAYFQYSKDTGTIFFPVSLDFDGDRGTYGTTATNGSWTDNTADGAAWDGKSYDVASSALAYNILDIENQNFMSHENMFLMRHTRSGAAVPPVEPWYDSNYQYRKKITIDSSKIDANLTDFPVCINLTDTDLSAARTDGFDILFTKDDKITKLKHEIESFNNGTGALVAWVKSDLLSATDVDIYLYYGYASASDQQDVVNTWDTDHKGVWHLNSSSDAPDSTSNNNDGTLVGGAGTNVALSSNGATAVASQAYSTSYDGNETNDNNTGTYWSDYNNYSSSNTLTNTLAAATTVSQVQIVTRYNWSYETLKDWDLQYYDGTTWQTIGTYTSDQTNDTTVTVNVPNITAQQWRITNCSRYNTSSGVGIYEFRIFEAAGPTSISGQIDKGLDFDGSADTVDCGNSASLDFTGPSTIEMWMYLDGYYSGWEQGLVKKDSSIRYFIRGENDGTNNRKPCLLYGASMNQMAFANSTLATGQWYHVVLAHDGTNYNYYVNGAPDGNGAFSEAITSSGNDVIISSAFDGKIDGKLDEFRISTVKRSADWVKVNYNNQKWPDKDDHGASGFFTVGTEETDSGGGGGTWYNDSWGKRKKLTLNHDEVKKANLVGYWKLDESAGNTTVDSSGNGHTGTRNNMEDIDWTTCKYGKGLDFDGSDESVVVNHSANLDITGSITICAWVYMDSDGSYPSVVTKTNSSGYPGYIFEFREGLRKINLFMSGPNGSWDNYANTAVPLSQWTHIVATYDGVNQLKYYFNGILDGTHTVAGGA
ncbi:DUF2341 domain-containing protein, partial [bacterium]|nr:DUF2341 domain-containing protein [bacterium]